MTLAVTQKQMKIILQTQYHVALAVPQVKSRFVSGSHLCSMLTSTAKYTIHCLQEHFLLANLDGPAAEEVQAGIENQMSLLFTSIFLCLFVRLMRSNGLGVARHCCLSRRIAVDTLLIQHVSCVYQLLSTCDRNIC